MDLFFKIVTTTIQLLVHFLAKCLLTLKGPARGLIGPTLVKSAAISKMGHPIFVAQT
jgi:hypothetical protein